MRVYLLLLWAISLSDTSPETGPHPTPPFYYCFSFLSVFPESALRPRLLVCVSQLCSASPQVHYILQEVVMGGMVLETNMNEIVAQVELQNRMEKSEVSRWILTIVILLLRWVDHISEGFMWRKLLRCLQKATLVKAPVKEKRSG